MNLKQRFFTFVMGVFLFGLATQAMAALTVSVSVNPDPIRPGETAHVELTVTNTGASPESNLTLETVMPDEVDNFLSPAFITGEVTCSGFCDSGEAVTWNIGTLAAGEGKTVSFPPVVTLGTIATTVTFTGMLGQSGVLQVTGSATAVIVSDPVLDFH